MADKDPPAEKFKKNVDPYYRKITVLRNDPCKSCTNNVCVYISWRKELVCWDCGMILNIKIVQK